MNRFSRRILESVTRAIVGAEKYLPSARKLVAVVVPASSRPGFTPDELVSLRHLRRHLSRYDQYLLVPQGSPIRVDGLKPLELPSRFFGSADAHNQLLHTRAFYRHFREYRYILIYHLDALVFRDELHAWCEQDYDFIGAPWIPCADTPWVHEPHVGNGGFALMKVESCLRVLHHRHRMVPATFWHENFAGAMNARQKLSARLRRNSSRAAKSPSSGYRLRANDRFWAVDAVRFWPEFRIADWRTGLKFAFEADPRQCFELNNQQLPFGCHAWARFDRGFWEPHLLEDPATAPLDPQFV